MTKDRENDTMCSSKKTIYITAEDYSKWLDIEGIAAANNLSTAKCCIGFFEAIKNKDQAMINKLLCCEETIDFKQYSIEHFKFEDENPFPTLVSSNFNGIRIYYYLGDLEDKKQLKRLPKLFLDKEYHVRYLVELFKTDLSSVILSVKIITFLKLQDKDPSNISIVKSEGFLKEYSSLNDLGKYIVQEKDKIKEDCYINKTLKNLLNSNIEIATGYGKNIEYKDKHRVDRTQLIIDKCLTNEIS